MKACNKKLNQAIYIRNFEQITLKDIVCVSGLSGEQLSNEFRFPTQNIIDGLAKTEAEYSLCLIAHIPNNPNKIK